MTNLSQEQIEALGQHPEGIEVQDPGTNKVYFLTDAELYKEAQEALRKQQDLEALREGIADWQAGRVRPYEEVDREMREKLGLPPRNS
ncbi:hypothetical protein [Calycomorphotria hydatis]|uniref:Uncharacterized protein n=1 Tax=Calycomorphotria hydatis TaxID=2528027 RepID=A0A517T6U5_9PLAN|nr:hypothetical protein [Calycomorphotria hydatis]QDT64077.1 hypothetical protein V22_13080 [Calycomorphotria hydatis]